jgi:hypothetical protein
MTKDSSKNTVQEPRLADKGEEALKLNKDYVVVGAEKFISQVNGYNGIRVTLDGGTDDILALPLWVSEIVSRKSKLGAFMVALGTDYDKWGGERIKVARWNAKDREVVKIK